MIEHSSHRGRHGIWVVTRYSIGIEAVFLGNFSPALRLAIILLCWNSRLTDNPPRNTDDRCAGWDITDHHRIRANSCVFTDLQWPKNFCASSNHHAISKRWMAFAVLPACSTKGNAMVERTVITNFSSFTNHYAHTMINKETAAKFSARMDFDTGKPARNRRNPTRQPFQSPMPQTVTQAMNPNSMQARIIGKHFKEMTSSWVSSIYAGDIFANSAE